MPGRRRLVLFCTALCLSASCAGPDDRDAEPAAPDPVDPDAFVHAMVRFAGAPTESELWDEGSGLLWRIPGEDVTDQADADGWWLVYLPSGYLDQLVDREGLDWRPLPAGREIGRAHV